MTFQRFTETEKQQVADAIMAVEKRSDAELITVVAKEADRYAFLPYLLAAVIALLLPLVDGVLSLLGSNGWQSAPAEWSDWLLWQWLLFIVISLVLRVPAIKHHLVPKKLRHFRAATLARCQFLEQNLHATREGTGMLIFVSEAERYVEILADRGISQKIPNSEWQAVVDDFTAKVKSGDTLQGFLDCINACADKLAAEIPATDQENELPNRLVVI